MPTGIFKRKHKAKDPRGYILIFRPKHPAAKPNGWIYEHRVIMENHLKRALKTHEHIHHLDKDTSNNSISNLILTNNSEHYKIYHKDAGIKTRFTTKNRLEYWKEHKISIDKICTYCKKKFTVSPSLERIKYCSQICYWKDKKGKKRNQTVS